MESANKVRSDEHAERMADTKRLLDEMEKLEMRARLLLAEHRHVVATMETLKDRIEAAKGPEA